MPATATKTDTLQEIHPSAIEPWPDLNPRKRFDPDAMAELEESIRARGNIQPVVVSPPPEGADASAEYWLVAGERRHRAAAAVDVPLRCVVQELTWEEAVEIAVIENLDRADLEVLEEAEGLRKLIGILGSQKAVAERLNRSQPWVSNRIRLLELPESVLALIEDGLIEASTARDVLLPFNRLKETARTAFFGKVAQRYRGLEGQMDGSAALSAVLNTVRQIAVEMSQAEADEKEAARVERAAKKARKKAEAIGDAAVMSMEDVRRLYGSEWTRIGTRSGFSPGTLIDPTRLPAESLILVEDDATWGGGRTLICTEPAKVSAAKGMVTREKNPRVEERRAQRLSEDLEAVEGMELEPWIVAQVLIHGHGFTNKVEAVAEELGIEVGFSHHSKTTPLDLDEAELLRWVKLVAYRAKRGDYDHWQDAAEAEIEAELLAEYGPLLKEMIPEAEEADGA